MFKAYYSEQAKKLAGWAMTEKNRVKASKLIKIAQKIERLNRIYHGDLNSGMPRCNGGCYTMPSMPLPW